MLRSLKVWIWVEKVCEWTCPVFLCSLLQVELISHHLLDIRDRESVHIAEHSAIVAPTWQEGLPIWVHDAVFAHDLVSEEKLSVGNDA